MAVTRQRQERLRVINHQFKRPDFLVGLLRGGCEDGVSQCQVKKLEEGNCWTIFSTVLRSLDVRTKDLGKPLKEFHLGSDVNPLPRILSPHIEVSILSFNPELKCLLQQGLS